MNNKLTLKSDILYRTYSETNGKAPINKYSDGQIIESYEHCLKYDSFCGMLNPDVILIDIDNEEHGECLKNIIECENISCKINKTERGYHIRSLNSNDGWNVTGCMSFLNMPILRYSNEIRSAVLIVHGEKAHSCYFSKDAFADMVKDNAYTENKELMIIPDTVHTDLYDGGGKNAIPFDKIAAFFQKNLK